MNYQESRAFIKESEKYGSVLGLENEIELLRRLGNPQDRIPVVHVAGTNGKGSVIAFMYQALLEAGYRVGRFNSPPLFHYLEQFEYCGKAMEEDAYAEVITEISQAVEDMCRCGFSHPTPFELETAAAYLWLAKKQADLAFIEVGMGGDLDATNVVKSPVLSVIASVSMDHMAFLGNTLPEIAEKKAGIIKDRCPAVTVKQKEEVTEVIRHTCETHGSALTIADPDKVKIQKENLDGIDFTYEGEAYHASLCGFCQKSNIALAMEALRVLSHCGFPASGQDLKKGFANVFWRGRFTVICRRPLFIVDGAHNPGAADALYESVSTYLQGRPLILITGMFKDKDYDYVMRTLCPLAEHVLTITPPNPLRALDSASLAACAGKYNPKVENAGDLDTAVRRAFSLVKEDGVILSCGSLSFIGDLTEVVAGRMEGEA